ncbi:hypothetical protein AUR64_16790 [Haloprofundus marisrubri]|uniref:Ligand-binding protein SH3 n=1 Tax=Haloprofundus marisrubri TaxID=1514971 RepID=A0A0W1R7P1_9EURY|nr:multidrug efflux SMR transporter [Haloprofundus marisrubri]KTG09434.1 hypothetical protein AUR64_16790 [Haloprofundus marisrubri]
MSWLLLLVAAVFEMVWALGLKHTDGFTDFWPSVGTLAAMAVSVYLLSMAVEDLPIGTAYAVWTGIGAAGTAIAGIYLFDEPFTAARIGFVGLIVLGVVGLQATGAGH